MNSTAAISTLVILVVIGSLKCNANKTELIVAVLQNREGDQATSIGINLAIEAAKNSSDLKAFLDHYEIVVDDSFYTKVSFMDENVIYIYMGYLILTKPEVNMAQLDIDGVLFLRVYGTRRSQGS